MLPQHGLRKGWTHIEPRRSCEVRFPVSQGCDSPASGSCFRGPGASQRVDFCSRSRRYRMHVPALLWPVQRMVHRCLQCEHDTWQLGVYRGRARAGEAAAEREVTSARCHHPPPQGRNHTVVSSARRLAMMVREGSEIRLEQYTTVVCVEGREGEGGGVSLRAGWQMGASGCPIPMAKTYTSPVEVVRPVWLGVVYLRSSNVCVCVLAVAVSACLCGSLVPFSTTDAAAALHRHTDTDTLRPCLATPY